MNKPWLLLPRRVLRLDGPDGRSFLNRLATADAPETPEAAPRLAALLTPQGKLIAAFHVWAEAEGSLLLGVAADRAEELRARLLRFRLRAQVEIADVSAAWAVEAQPLFTGPQAQLRLIAATAAAAPDEAAWREARIRAGVPDFSEDFVLEEPFALEALLEELGGVDFRKGCFPGQENVSRMKRRATTRRKLCRIAFEGPPPAFGAPILGGAAALGDVRTGVDGAALAFVRLDRALAAAAQGVSLTAEGRPLTLDPPDWLILPAADRGEDG